MKNLHDCQAPWCDVGCNVTNLDGARGNCRRKLGSETHGTPSKGAEFVTKRQAGWDVRYPGRPLFFSGVWTSSSAGYLLARVQVAPTR